MTIPLRKTTFLAITLSIIVSCNKELGDAPIHTEDLANNKTNIAGKYLRFKTKRDFALYLQEVKNGGNGKE